MLIENKNRISLPKENIQTQKLRANEFSKGNYSQINASKDSFSRINLEKLSFGSVSNPPQVYEDIKPANKDLQNVELGSKYNFKTKSLDVALNCSKDAGRAELCLFKKPFGEKEVARIPLHKLEEGKWAHSLSKQSLQEVLKDPKFDIEKGDTIYYGYRVFGKPGMGENEKPISNWGYDGAIDWTINHKKKYNGFIRDVDKKGNRFNPCKVLFDPNGLELSHDPESQDLIKLDEDGSVYLSGNNLRDVDTAPYVPKSVFNLKLQELNKEQDFKPLRPITDQVIYEAQIMGLTKKLNKEVLHNLYSHDQKMKQKVDKEWKDEYAGTYKGATFMIPYLKDMGITMVEFLPVMEFQNSVKPEEPSRLNPHRSWGYMTNSFFAPDKQLSAADKNPDGYKPGDATQEFKDMVKEFRANDMDVCLDVVYNHTGEGGVGENPNYANLLSYRGINNQGYYLLAEDKRYYHNASGCGNTINAKSKVVQDLVISSLKHWQNLGVTAFRFDLASILGNNKEEGFDFNASSDLLKRIEGEIGLKPSQNHRKGSILISEPWSCEGVNQGDFNEIWNEWSGGGIYRDEKKEPGFRDTMRKALNNIGKDGRPAPIELIKAICGSKELMHGYNAHNEGKTPRSVNFITAHDGFTLYDSFAFNKKKNTNDLDSGHKDNHSWDQYWDNDPEDINRNNGKDGTPHPFKRRERAIKTGLSLLMLSAGTPMMLYGDERYHSKNGNNNTYNFDEKNIINWDHVIKNKDDKGNTQTLNASNLTEFTKRLINFRHDHKALHPDKYYKGEDTNENNGKDIAFYDMHGKDINEYNNADEFLFGNHSEDWQDVLGFRYDETEFEPGKKPEEVDHPTIYNVFNRGIEAKEITLPKHLMQGMKWHKSIDTSVSSTALGSEKASFDQFEIKPAYKNGEMPEITDINPEKDGIQLKISPRTIMAFVEEKEA